MGKKQNDTPMTEVDAKRIRRNAYIKMAAMAGIVAAAMAFGSIAWFTQNREVEGTGVQMMASYNGFELQVTDGTIGFSNLYDYLESAIHGNSDTITKNIENGQYIRWRMADGDEQLKPSSEGELNFKVISTGADLNTLHYSINLRVFTEIVETSEKQQDGKTVTIQNITGLNEITSTNGTAEQKKGADFLKHHILYFKNRTGTENDGYQYSDLISDPSDFQLTLDEENNATIYWVWVNTFGQMALTSSDTQYIKTNLPILNTAGETKDRETLTAYITDNANKIFNGSENYASLLSSLYTKRKNSESYQDEFDKLSDGYNSADQTIGGQLDYTLIQLTAVSK